MNDNDLRGRISQLEAEVASYKEQIAQIAEERDHFHDVNVRVDLLFHTLCQSHDERVRELRQVSMKAAQLEAANAGLKRALDAAKQDVIPIDAKRGNKA